MASLLTVWSHLKPRSRERGGRTPPQKGGNRCKLPTTPDRAVCPSGSRFRSIAKDLESLREMPSFALSRRQRGFESRWGHKLKVALTRPDTRVSQPASPGIDRQGRAGDARTPTGAALWPSSRSADLACRLDSAGVVLSRGWTSSGTARHIGTLQRRPSTIERHLQAELATDASATTRRVRSALRTRDVDRSSRSLRLPRPFTFQRLPEGEK